MALSQPMSQDEIQKEIHALYQNGIDVPVAGDLGDYDTRTVMINHYIRVWEMLDGMNWRELRDIDTSSTLDTPNVVISLPARFRELVGQVKVRRPSDGHWKDVTVYSQERLDDSDLDNTGYAWTSGENGAFKLNFMNVDSDYVGGMIQYRFVRYANRMTAPEDVPDMSNPQYLVSMVVARLFKLAGRTTDYQVNFDDAQDAMSGMITYNIQQEEDEVSEAMGDRIKGFGIMGL